MTKQTIKTELRCSNIAPLIDLSKEINSDTLKIGVFASNGSGKTFISRLFRLLEKRKGGQDVEFEITNKLLTIGEKKGSFGFKITDKKGVVKEDISIEINRGDQTTIPNSKYIYHVFNEDYVEENLRDLDYDKEGDIEGFILGKSNIDLSDDEDLLKLKLGEGKVLSEKIQSSIQNHIQKNIDGIPNIKRLTEYKELLNKDKVIDSVGGELLNLDSDKEYRELINDYDKIKSVPENLERVDEVSAVEPISNLIDEIFHVCNTEYSLSHFSQEFKDKIVSKRAFIENGLKLIKNDSCPFCEQKFEQDALDLIDSYNTFLEDSESKTQKKLDQFLIELATLNNSIEIVRNQNIASKAKFDEYKHKYISSSSEIELDDFDINTLNTAIDKIVQAIETKKKEIQYAFEIPHSVLENVKNLIEEINRAISSNNSLIDELNYKIENISDENKAIRKAICKRVFNDLIINHSEEVQNLRKLREDYQRLKEEIDKKKEGIKISKRKKVAETIKKILSYFFDDKYALDIDTFRLTFNKKLLDQHQAKDILSTGEKSLLAFAYYIGDTHLLIEKQEDYNNLFFIIDDPISSMDFTHVYTVSGLIRDIDHIIEGITQKRIFVFSHNSDFMRIVSSNSIIDSTFLLKDGALKEFNENLTVPYIYHLIDVYSIAKKKSLPNHSSANSIRHILETLTKFENVNMRKHSISSYVKENIKESEKTYTLIQDLSHGAWRTEQSPIGEGDYINICMTIVSHIETKFPGQIQYCSEMVD